MSAPYTDPGTKATGVGSKSLGGSPAAEGRTARAERGACDLKAAHAVRCAATVEQPGRDVARTESMCFNATGSLRPTLEFTRVWQPA